MTTPSEVHELRELLLELTTRVERLEGATPAPLGTGTLWALETLRAQRAEHPSTAEGTVLLSGSLTLPSGAPVEWQQSAGTAALLDGDWADRAAEFAALGHPVRVELLRHILNGSSTTAELAGLDGLGTTGQLHHHLRELLASGWIAQAARGSYEVPPARIVPLLVCLVAVAR